MDFFADGGFQQLFCDLNEHIVELSPYKEYNYNKIGDTSYEENCLYFEEKCSKICYLTVEEKINYNAQLTDLNEKQLQTSLDYLLNSTNDSLEDYNFNTLSILNKDLSDWEDKFLDNYIEIPELVNFLPEKTPLCTETCNHFLQESAENLKLFASSPSSPASPVTHDKSYPCTFGDCQKIYAKPAHLKAHLRRHLGEKPYICNWTDCTWRFSRSDELARHRRSHSGVKPYKCDFCAKCFARSDHLTKHRKVHERRLLAASKAGKTLENGELPQSVLTVRPGRKRKNQL